MKKFLALSLFIFSIVFITGCIVRTYPVVKDRVDQDVSGNQGYLAGDAPQVEQTENRPAQRTTYTTEIELKNLFKFEKLQKPPAPIEEKTETITTEDTSVSQEPAEAAEETTNEPQTQVQKVDIYIVKSGDTLQKISARAEVYSDGKKWTKIYEANKDALKNPNKIYAGQKLKIPRD